LQNRYHLDTNYLIELLESFLPRRKSPDQADFASEAVHGLGSKGFEVCVSDTVVGETVNVIITKKYPIHLNDFASLIQKKQLKIVHVREDEFRHFARILIDVRKADRELETNDVRIIAHSMVDRECRGLLTFERKLIESRTLKEFIATKVRFKKRYSVTDNPNF